MAREKNRAAKELAMLKWARLSQHERHEIMKKVRAGQPHSLEYQKKRLKKLEE